MTAAISTAGGVVFAGDLDRRFRAFDVRTGAILWETRLATSVQGFPVTFSIDGKQYLAVTTGNGGGSPRAVPATIAPELHPPATGNALYVFALPDVSVTRNRADLIRSAQFLTVRLSRTLTYCAMQPPYSPTRFFESRSLSWQKYSSIRCATHRRFQPPDQGLV